jgi:ketosteroid isomerase-like protein
MNSSMTRHFAVLFCGLVAGCIAGPVPRSEAVSAEPGSAAEAEIRSLMSRIQNARAMHDPSAVEEIYSDDFYIVHNNGAVRSKNEWLQTFRAADFQGQPEQMRFKHLGSTVLVLADVHVTGKLADGRPVELRERVTYVWVHRGGRWQLGAMHGTRLRQ